jgi:hypothetical protein
MNIEIEKAIEQLKSLKEICLYGEDGHEPPLVAIELSKVYDLAITALEAQKDDAWIPVTERLPEETGHYKVTVKYKRDGTTQTEKMLFMGKEFGLMKWKNDYERYCDVTAWKPLDEPYEEEQP